MHVHMPFNVRLIKKPTEVYKMKCKALVTGVEEIKFTDKDTGEKKSFFKVNFIDLDNEAGKPQDMSLSKDPAELAKEFAIFAAARLKTVTFNIFLSGKYANFGGMVT